MNAKLKQESNETRATKAAERHKFSHYHAEFANFHEGYVRHYIALADTKAGVVFALASSAIAYIFSNADTQQLLFSPTPSWPTALAYVTSIALISAAGFAAWVIAPRTPSTGEGLVFFGAVQNYSNDASYVEAVRQSSEPDLTEARLRHCYNVAGVCWRKYRALRAAMFAGILGLALLLGTSAVANDTNSGAPTKSGDRILHSAPSPEPKQPPGH